MSKKNSGKIVIALFLCFITFRFGFSQKTETPPVRIMFYNVENLFDIYDDSLTEDDEFLPGGVMRWTSARYEKKVNSIYKTIIAAGGWEPPAVVAFCEVENRRTLEDLIYGTNLSKYNYGIIHEESPDRRGIDVCLIYRKDIAEVTYYKYWVPSGTGPGEFTTRSVLYARLALGLATINIIVNHWPSRRGGVLAGEDLRLRIASMIRARIDSISSANREVTKIVILGDFNCTPEDEAVKLISYPPDSINPMVNLSESLNAKGFGTYRYSGIWEMIDQVIISKNLLSGGVGLFAGSEPLSIFRPDFLLMKDTKYPGFSPFSTYRGFRYQGGYSDHLPVLLELRIR